jgi:hypothetical protein
MKKPVQHEHDGARGAANPVQCPGEHGQRPGHVRCGEPLLEVEPDRPAAHLDPGRHGSDPGQDQEQPAPSGLQQGGGHVGVLPMF